MNCSVIRCAEENVAYPTSRDGSSRLVIGMKRVSSNALQRRVS